MIRSFSKKRLVIQVSLSYLLSILVAFFTYISGGTKTAVTTTMFVVVVLASITPYPALGLVHALFCGLLVGPFMPLDVELGTPQTPFNWILRMVDFCIISIFISTFVRRLKREYEKNQAYTEEMAQSHLATIYALVKIAESRDDETGAHIERVSELAKLLAIKLRESPMYRYQIDDQFIYYLYRASPLHDIGKVGIPDHILLKRGKLTDEEFEVIKKHPIIGAHILFDVYRQYPNNEFLRIGYEIVRFHHERYDGTGYPDGLKGEQIPLPARIMAVVDVYDALRSKRIYKDPYTHDESIDIIRNERGKHFDPHIVDIFLKYHEEFNERFNQFTETTPHSSLPSWMAYRPHESQQVE